ncbi:MAG: CO dehydrogenase/CO-methylating acetyl-CoA synthase complex subunit beta [Elusimicrobia bacterium]|nr:CO dehydrogenase/CO-methylating acetyl-CoA synthase complex subunit beta [Candidatus Liberimonas magnetica]
MSKIVATAVMSGAAKILADVKEKYKVILNAKGPEFETVFPGTAYYLPMIFALTGVKIQKLKDIGNFLSYAEKLIHNPPLEKNWLPYLGDALDSGLSTLMLEEILMMLKYIEGTEPKEGYLGFLSDTQMRTLGIQLVDGRMPGFAAILGAPKDAKAAVKIVRELQEKSILIFLSGSSNGYTMKKHLEAEGVEMGWDTYIVPLGEDTESTIYALDWAIRSALTFGGLHGGAGQKCLEYCRDRVFAFGLAFGELDDLKYATGAGAIAMGFPIIADTDIPEILPTGVCTYEELVKEKDLNKMVSRAIEVRGVKITVSKPPIPVLYGAAFEGERVRAVDVAVEFGGKYTKAFEYVEGKELSEITDGKIEVIGKEIDEVEEGGKLYYGMVAYVAGRNMQKDFEPVIERQMHRLINQAAGVMHIGQRNIVWLRISKEARKNGFKISDLGRIVHTKFKDEFPSIVDKVEVHIYTQKEEAEKYLGRAMELYTERDKRMGAMTDESVDTFYSCTLCQSFAPNHVCIITPERLGLCGAYNWLDGKAAHQIKPTGPNQPVVKGHVIDAVIGEWKGINDFVYKSSNKTLERFSAYSIIKYPMTSCGCFECILAVLPGTGGVMVVDRTFMEMTPCGMTFSTLAGVVGGGQQTPGFLGVGLNYLVSKKFISAEGGLKRLVWMPAQIKERFRAELLERATELGVPDLLDKIADEKVTNDIGKLIEFLSEKKHPALEMGELV